MGNSRAEEHRQAYLRQVARRRFFIKTLGLGAAGLVAGGAAAWTKSELEVASTAGASLADMKLQLENALAARSAAEQSYAALQTQSAEWQVQLTAANNQNAQLSSSLASVQSEAANLRSQLASLQSALDSANARLARSTELISLYDQLEAAGLDGLVQNGMASVSGVMAGLLGTSEALRGGVESARSLLSNFESTLPDFQGAMQWLGEHVVRLKAGLWTVESSAQQTVNSALTGIAAAFSGFAGFIIDNLPFNIGRQVRNTLSATQSVLANLTQMTDNAGDQVLLKISRHVDDSPQGWKQSLVGPLRSRTLAAADEVVSASHTASSTYQSSLETPAGPVLERRRQLREQIASHRAAHGL
jgi:molecular chaperone GrpE (heat shock protein)